MKIKLDVITKKQAVRLLWIAFQKGKNDIWDYEFQEWLNKLKLGDKK